VFSGAFPAMKYKVTLILLLSVLLIQTVSQQQFTRPIFCQEGGRGAYLDEVVFIHYLDETIAVKEVQAGNVHTYFWRIPLELAAQLKRDPNLLVYEAPGGMMSLLLNPAPVEGQFNPFTIREVRYAVNYLVNRDFIVNEILSGYGVSTVSAYGPYDPDYLVVADEVEALGFKYNPEVANRIFSDALAAAGAMKVDGRWIFKGAPIKLRFFIRSDDPRRLALGEALSSDLERIGLTVEKVFGDLTKVYDVVYGSDPKTGQWHLYTEGWGRSAFVKYDSVLLSQMYAPWYGYMPGFMEPTYWNYEQKNLDEITKKITTGNFTSKEEREGLLRKATSLGINEAVRIFLASNIDLYVVNKAVAGIVNDFGAGITGRWSLVNARVRDKVGGSLKIGMKQIYQGAWNPVAGLTDYYATRVWYGISDPATFTHPHTGDVIPVRAAWKVETAGPKGKLSVPADAIVWDPYEERWRAVGESVTAISKVTIDLNYSNWHHGVPMRMADILYGVYFFFEWGTKEGPDDPTFDPEYTSRAEPAVKLMKGIRFLKEDKVEVYVDYWHFDDSYIADYAVVWATTPWEVQAAMEKVVLDRKAAFSRSASKAQKVEWLCQIIKSHADMIKAALDDFRGGNVTPKPLRDYVSISEAKERYDAAIRWIERYGHAAISNGPLYLVGYNPEARTITLRAFRDQSYPFEPGHWRTFELLKTAEVKMVEAPFAVIIGKPATIKVSVEVGKQPSNEVLVSYRITDPEGATVTKGDARLSSTVGTFEISLGEEATSKLKAGSYTLRIFAVSAKAIKPYLFETSFLVSTVSPPPPPPPPRPEAYVIPLELMIALVAVVAAVATLIIIIRRRPSKS